MIGFDKLQKPQKTTKQKQCHKEYHQESIEKETRRVEHFESDM